LVKITVVNDMLSNLQKDIGNAFEFFVVRQRRFEDATNALFVTPIAVRYLE